MTKKKAKSIVAQCYKKYNWREGGENAFAIFKMPELNIVNTEYKGVS